MENVQFNEESIARSAPAAARQSKGMAGFLIKKGWARDDKGAQYILLGIAVVALVTSGFFWMQLANKTSTIDAAPVPLGAGPGIPQ
jgi:hypothetical protein